MKDEYGNDIKPINYYRDHGKEYKYSVPFQFKDGTEPDPIYINNYNFDFDRPHSKEELESIIQHLRSKEECSHFVPQDIFIQGIMNAVALMAKDLEEAINNPTTLSCAKSPKEMDTIIQAFTDRGWVIPEWIKYKKNGEL